MERKLDAITGDGNWSPAGDVSHIYFVDELCVLGRIVRTTTQSGSYVFWLALVCFKTEKKDASKR